MMRLGSVRLGSFQPTGANRTCLHQTHVNAADSLTLVADAGSLARKVG